MRDILGPPVAIIIAQWVEQFVAFALWFLLPLLLEGVRGYSALDTGLSLLPMAIGSAIFMPLGGALFDRIGARLLVMAGGLLMALAGFMLVGGGVHMQGHDLILPLFLYGVGVGLGYMPLTTQVTNPAPRHLVGRVTSLTYALLQLVNALSVALFTTSLTARPDYRAGQRLINQLQAQTATLQAHRAGQGAAAAHDTLPAPITSLFVHAFVDTFALLAVMGLIAGRLGIGLRRHMAAQQGAEASGEIEFEPQLELLAGLSGTRHARDIGTNGETHET